MTPDASPTMAPPLGREDETAVLRTFLADLPRGPAAVVVEGEPGIGKSTIWRAGVGVATTEGVRVLSASPVEAESQLSFAGLSDLLDGADDLIERLPDPMRAALGVAMLREEAGEHATDARAVNAATAAAVHAAGDDGPTLIAIDDAPWLDRATAAALTFAMRRVSDAPIGVLLTVRGVGATLPLGLGRSVEPGRVTRLPLSALDRDALDAIVRERFGASLPRPILDRIAETSAGNPFFALEIAAAAVRGDQRATGQSLPIPRDLRDDLIRDRLGRLAAAGREALLYAAAAAHPTTELLGAAVGRSVEDQLAKAADAGLVAFDGAGVRFTHPLYGSAIYADASRDRRHRVHRRLSEVVHDPEERARHLALAAEGSDPEASAALEVAAAAATARGAPAGAAELLELAERLLPEDRPTDLRRVRIAAAEARSDAGDPDGALLELAPLAADATPGPERGAVLERLARTQMAVGDLRGARASFDVAADQEGLGPLARAEILTGRSAAALVLGELADAERDADEGLRLARKTDVEDVIARASSALATARAWRGRGVDRALAEAAETGRSPAVSAVRAAVADLLLRIEPGDVAESHAVELLEEAFDAGDEAPASTLHRSLAWFDVLSGTWDRADDHLRRTVGSGPDAASALGVRAILSALRGRDDEAEALIAEASTRAERMGSLEASLFARSASGVAALARGDASGAVHHLAPAWDAHRAADIGEPTLYPFLADLAEASIEAGSADLARMVTTWLEERGRALDRPWALGAAARCRGLLASVDGDPAGATDALEEALAVHEALGWPFEVARTLLCLGGVHRRAKRKRAGRDALERAASIFDGLGATAWAERARAEEARIGGRRAAGGSLTEAERRVYRLVLAGLTNREIADALYMSVRTVEGHVSHILRKRGARSRAELIAFGEPDGEGLDERNA